MSEYKKTVIMFLTNEFAPDVRVYKEAVYLISKGVDVTILCWDRQEKSCMKNEEIIDGINVVRFNLPSEVGSGVKQFPAFIKYIRACKKWLRNKMPEYYHCNDIDGAITWRFAKISKAPMIFDMHEFYEGYSPQTWWSAFLYRKLTTYFIKRSKYALYENNLYLRRNYRKIWTRLLPLKNYPDNEMVKNAVKIESEVFRIGYHGGVRHHIRAFEVLFEAVKDMEDVRVDINGDGPGLVRFREMAANYENVFVNGPFDGTKELTKLYSESDLIYMGYNKESKSAECDEMVKFFESIVTGTPMILTEGYKYMADQIREGGFGIVCDTYSINEVRKAILKLKDDKEYWKQCSENELRNAYKYDWNEAVKVLDKCYDLA